MADEGKLRQQAERGERAKRLLENELLQEAFASVEKAIDDGWKGTSAHEKEQRENAYMMHRLLGNFREHIAQVVRTGDGAAKQLLRIEQESKLKRFVNGRR